MSNYSSFVYFDHCLHLPPYFQINNGIGANATYTPANTVNPHPYPTDAFRGAIISGKNVPIRHLEIRTAVNDDAEYSVNASTTYDIIGRITNMSVKPIRLTARSINGHGRVSWAVQP
jgi:hypothetical protein